MIITIDGPSASGKSTVACALAEGLGFAYLNTGLLFRALAYILQEKEGYTLEQMKNPDPQEVMRYLDPQRLYYEADTAACGSILFDGRILHKSLLNTSVMDQMASIVSTNPSVRQQIECLERAIAAGKNIIIDGRDAGSKVFPHAEVKFYLEASVEVRAKRWQLSQQKKGHNFSLQEAQELIRKRDKRDKERSIAPLIVPEGAHIIDNSALTERQTLDLMNSYIVLEKKKAHR